jgi:Tfp pilus assembly protein PilF
VHTALHFSLACLFSLSVSYVALTYVLAALASWYLYYAGPFKLKRFPLLGGFVAGAALLFTLSLGYSAYAGASASLWLPGSVSALCLFIPAISMLATEVWSPSNERFSLSSLLGEVRARRVVGAGVFVSCLMPAAFLAMPWLFIPGAVAGCVGIALLARAPTRLLPAALGGLAAALVLSACVMGASGAPLLRSQLEATGFSETSRRAGTFALSDESPEAVAAMEKGLELFQQGDYEAAAEAFRVILETDPESVDAYVSIGSSYLRLERLSEAARAFRKAIDLDAGSAKARVGLGQTYQLYQDYDAAFEELTKALEIAPDDPEVIYALAVFFQKVGNAEREVAALEETLARDPGKATAYRRLAEIHMKAETPEKAVETLNRALDSGIVFEHLHTQLAQAYHMMGDLEAAERETRREIERNPRLPSSHAVLAGLLAEQGKRDEAIVEYGRAISLTNDARLKARLEEEIESLGGRPTQSAAP